MEQARALLVLGRVSNLPTVWSNCLAAWLLGGGGYWPHFPLLTLGSTLLYTGGMFLNDAFDIEFDRRYRPERPIIAGQVSARFVWSAGASFLGLGWLCLLALGSLSALFGFLLVATIIGYDAVHKKTGLAPLLMAGCRFLLYLVAASGARLGCTWPVVWSALALAGYIVGLSYVARRESTQVGPVRWPIPLLFVPLGLGLVARWPGGLGLWIAALALGSWITWCVAAPKPGGKTYLQRGVAGLLAGIALVDWLAVSSRDLAWGAGFLGLFLLALVLQKVAPAT